MKLFALAYNFWVVAFCSTTVLSISRGKNSGEFCFDFFFWKRGLCIQNIAISIINGLSSKRQTQLITPVYLANFRVMNEQLANHVIKIMHMHAVFLWSIFFFSTVMFKHISFVCFLKP